jgi:hypothetical protein
MKNIWKITMVIFVFALFSSCNKRMNNENDLSQINSETHIEIKNDVIDDEPFIEIKEDIFAQDIFYNIFENPEQYINNPNFSYEEYVFENRHKGDPEECIIVKNNEIAILFFPDITINYETWKLNKIYKLQLVTIKEKTSDYYFGKYIGMTSDRIIKEYPNYSSNLNRKRGESHIMYTSEGWEKFINFTFQDDIVVEINYGYEI